MKIKLRNLVDIGLLNLEWVGVSGESKFHLENGDKKISRWKFLKINPYDEDGYSPDDEVLVTESEYAEGSIWKINNKHNTACIVKIFNWW